MAIYQDGNNISMKSADTSVPSYRVVGVSSVGNRYVAIPNTSTLHIWGVSQSDASATGEAVTVRIFGGSKAVCGVSVSAGCILTFQTSTGKVIPATITDDTTTSTVPKTIGLAVESGSTNSVIEIVLQINNLKKDASA